MATVFPLNPTVNQTYTTGGITWRWTGALWELFTDVAQVFEHVHSYDGAIVSVGGASATLDGGEV
jgi:transcriptional regulator GlxA family with amidase domain